jgi:hypothetical protein
MLRGTPKRDRLESLVALAQAYRGLSRREVADALGRDLHNIVPETGNPKLDLVVRLAELLDWRVEMVVRDLYAEESVEESGDLTAAQAKEANRRAWELLGAERWDDVLAITESTIGGDAPEESRAYASMLRFFALESQGRYVDATEAAQQGLLLAPIGSDLSLHLRERLAYARYVTGSLFEAEGLACSLIATLGACERSSPLRQVLAGAHAIRGHSLRVAVTSTANPPSRVAEAALEDLRVGACLYDDFAVRGGTVRDASSAAIARGGMLELEAFIGRIGVGEALERFSARLDGSEEIDSVDSSEAESIGWWCIFGAHVAMRHLHEREDAERWVGIFTNKADEVAERLGHWALRERLLSIDHQVGPVAPVEDRPFDREDLKTVTGAMSRFPQFRSTGWEILRCHGHVISPRKRAEQP